MSETIKKDQMEDPNNEGLQAVMGKHFQDQTQEHTHVPKWGQNAELAQVSAEKKSRRKVMGDSCKPAKGKPTDIERVAACAKQALLYGGISALLFWWQQADLLASEAAVPSFIVLALLTGLKIGSCAVR